MYRIVRRSASAPSPALASALPPVLASLYASRGVQHPDEIDYSLKHLPPFESMKGMHKAVELLTDALEQAKTILVVGDFDADGATSVAVAVRALRAMGARVDFLIPNRFENGYGLTPEIVTIALENKPDLIVTVDNGIASIEGVAAAREAGIAVVVTDHHLPGSRLPEADAIVNPNQPGDAFPSKSLAGVGVIFYVMLALRSALRERGWFDAGGRQEPNLAQLLDLVALGTVADIVPLDRLNRTLVSNGLARIRAGACCLGIRALAEAAGRNLERFVSSDLGFSLGPRINAAGRLEDMSIGVRCLLADEEGEARTLASELDALNRARRSIEGDMQESALQQIDSLIPDTGELPHGVCLYDPDWHEGVIGLLASHIKERLHRPVIVFTNADAGGIKGSARSIPGLHMRDTLDAVAKRHPDLILKFGGHAMAAGLTVRQDGFERFHQSFVEEARRRLSPEALEGVLLSDGELTAADLELAERLRAGGPWGQGFPEPMFDGIFEVIDWKVLKDKHLKFQVRWPANGKVVSALAFNTYLENWRGEAKRVHLAYRLDVNDFRGERSVNLIVEQWEIAA